MNITTNLKIFALLSAVYAAVFFYVLYHGLEIHSWPMVMISPFVYGIIVWVTARKLATTDDQSTTRLKLGFTYHFVAYIVVNSIHVLWFSVGWTPADYTFFEFIPGPGFWGMGLLIHYFLARNSIKDYPKREVFD